MNIQLSINTNYFALQRKITVLEHIVFVTKFCLKYFSCALVLSFSRFLPVASLSFYRLQWGIHCGICIVILKQPLPHIEELVNVSSSEWQGFYKNCRQCHVLFNICERDLPGNIPRRSSSLFYVVLFLNSNVSYLNVIEINRIWIK